MRRRGWTEEELKRAVKTSFSYRQVLKKLGLVEAGGNYEQIKRYIREFKLDSSHFRGMAWSAGLRGIGKPHIPMKDILKKGSHFQSFKLKKRLFSDGLKKEECERCKWAQKTKDGYLPLELHHKNGDRHDNRLENLMILCPNCHSLEPLYRGRARKKPGC